MGMSVAAVAMHVDGRAGAYPSQSAANGSVHVLVPIAALGLAPEASLSAECIYQCTDIERMLCEGSVRPAREHNPWNFPAVVCFLPHRECSADG